MEHDKVFNDPVHSSVPMPPYCQVIIDTPEFQRLRFIKQLGSTCYVFPSAVHTRFEHSIGVSHLAKRLAESLRLDGRLKIQDNDIACVAIAGLCHDLGHGPYSHVFTKFVSASQHVNSIESGHGNTQDQIWSHEDQSIVMFKYMIEHNQLERKLENFNIFENDRRFICEIILGRPITPTGAEGANDGRRLEKKFYLHQIVNNSVNGVDVDKWDYLARDTLYLGMKSAFDFNRIMPYVKVYDVERTDHAHGKTTCRKELCFRDKVAGDLNHMFLTRRRLHNAAYQHRVSRIVTIMLKDAFMAANKDLVFACGQKMYTLEGSLEVPMAFSQVNDTIVNEIIRSRSESPGIIKAKKIIDRIHSRQLYQCIGEYKHVKETLTEGQILDWLLKENQRADGQYANIWKKENLEVEVSYFENENGQESPLLKIPFYNKSNGKSFFLDKEQLPLDQPRNEGYTIYIYTKVPNGELTGKTLDEAKQKCKRLLERRFGAHLETQLSDSDVVPSGEGEKDFEDLLQEIANGIIQRTSIDRLGSKLGFGQEETQRYIQTNDRNGDYMGTLNMLRDWRKRTKKSEEREQLREALLGIKCIRFAEKLNCP